MYSADYGSTKIQPASVRGEETNGENGAGGGGSDSDGIDDVEWWRLSLAVTPAAAQATLAPALPPMMIPVQIMLGASESALRATMKWWDHANPIKATSFAVFKYWA
jgi:hypothetical protein